METTQKITMSRLKPSDLHDLAFLESSWAGDLEDWKFRIEPMIPRPRVYGIVARDESETCCENRKFPPPAGYCVFRLGDSLKILHLAVDAWLIGRGIGTAIIDHMKGYSCRTFIVDVPEENLAAQLFFKSNGFRAMRPKNQSTIYRMLYRKPKTC